MIKLKYYIKILRSLFFYKKIINPKKKQILVYASQYNFDEKGIYKNNLIKQLIKKKYPNKKIYFILEPFSSIKIKKGYEIETSNFYSFLNLIIETIFSLSIRKIFWKKLIDKFEPYIVYGEHLELNIMQTCIDKKIYCYEIQHGIIDEKIKYYKNFFQFITQQKEESLKKSGLIVWNNQFKEFFEEKFKKRFCKVAHNPNNTFKIKDKNYILKVLKNQKNIILISLQDRLEEIYKLHKEKNFLYKNLIPKFLIDYIKKNKKFLWIIRFHPRITKSEKIFSNSSSYLEIKYLFKNERNVLFNYDLSKVNLKNLLKFCKIHLTDSSATCLLSLDLNILTGVWNPLFKKKKYLQEWFMNSKKIFFFNKRNINLFLNQKNKYRVFK